MADGLGALARSEGRNTMDAQGDGARALDEVAEPTAPDASAAPPGEQFLLFWLGAWPCLAPLAEMREALPQAPRHVALPFSPRWLWGIFPLRTDIVALVDPVPILTYGPDAARDADVTRRAVAPPAGGFGQAEPLRALVVGEEDHPLALLADRIGDIYALRPEDQRPLDEDDGLGAAPLSRYVTAGYAVAGLERPALALCVSRLAEDLLAALEERVDDE